MRYRRSHLRGGTFFFTVNLQNRSSRLLVEQVDLLRQSVLSVKARHPFRILGWVVLPDHLHALWTLPAYDGDNAARWRLIKAGFSRAIPRGEWRNASRIDKGERGIWQRRFREHVITDEEDLRRHLDNIHINPVEHGHVARASDWPYSTIHRYIRAGIMPVDWASCGGAGLDARGER